MTAQNQFTIRYAKPEDAFVLSELATKTFYDTFAKDNSPEDMNAYLAESLNPSEMAVEISDASFISFLIEKGSIAVGYAQLHTGDAPECIHSENPIELARIYVSQDFIGSGVGAKLMQRCLDEAKSLGHQSIYLGVWEHNLKAQSFYQKWGFQKVGEHPFKLGNDMQTDWIMEKLL
ncbi:MAG: GNAT family N-acetyltransferase [Acidobacteriota bacterium]